MSLSACRPLRPEPAAPLRPVAHLLTCAACREMDLDLDHSDYASELDLLEMDVPPLSRSTSVLLLSSLASVATAALCDDWGNIAFIC